MTARITERDIRTALSRVITDDDEIIVIFNGIWMFASLLAVPTKEVPKYLVDIILDYLGPERTVLLPSYTYRYCGDRIYDSVLSKPETGVLACHAVTRGEFTRTWSPINSYAVAGPRTDEIMSLEEKTQWGDDSLMGWYDRMNARVCVLGEPWHVACTVFHRAEEKLLVPYRYFKSFPGERRLNGQFIKAIDAQLFVRPLNVMMIRDYTKVAPKMKQKGLILKADHPDFPLESALTQDVVATCVELLSRDVFGYVGNKEQIIDWIDNEKAQEIAQARIS